MELVLCYSDPPGLNSIANPVNNTENIFESHFPLEEFINGLKQFYCDSNCKKNNRLITDEKYKELMNYVMSHFQNSVSFGNGFGKTSLTTGFSTKSKVAFPKTEVLEKPLISKI